MKWSCECLTNLPQIDRVYLHSYEEKKSSSGVEGCKKGRGNVHISMLRNKEKCLNIPMS